MPQHFPFSAVVGADDMGLALILTTISPSVGGVLVRGEKGTAKSTMVRALADVLPAIDVYAGDRFSIDPHDLGARSPDGPFTTDSPVEQRPVRLVELPVGATEDRVLGSLHLQKALSEGAAEFEPGLLARAHRGILYVDEVNLLHDHLVDLLLDAAAMGSSTVERDGVSVVHDARFTLVGTMNPEEGELRPQLLDRFGLTVEVAAPRDPASRVEVVRRRIAFDIDPVGFNARFADEERALTDRILAAQKLVDHVELSNAALLKIAEICAAFDVDGMRADIVTSRAAVAHAAWHERTRVTKADIRAAALLALPHRRRRNPFDAPGIDEDLLDSLLDDHDDPEPPEDDPNTSETTERSQDESAPPTQATQAPPHGPQNSTDDGLEESQHDHERPPVEPEAEPPADPDDTGRPEAPAAGAAPTLIAQAGAPFKPRLFTVAGTGAGEAGHRSRAITSSGRRIASTPHAGAGGSIDLVETIRAAAPHQAVRRRAGRALIMHPDDLRVAVKEGRESNLVLFCVDASGSMAAKRRMEQVKTAILSLLLDAYQRRDKVGLVTFRGRDAELTLPPTTSIDIAARRLSELPSGGRTPLAEGLTRAADTLRWEAVRDPRRRALLTIVTDGRATAGSRPVERSVEAARHLRATGVDSLVIDCETGPFRMGLAHALAGHLHAEHVPLGEIDAAALTATVRTHLSPDHDPSLSAGRNVSAVDDGVSSHKRSAQRRGQRSGEVA